MNSENGFGGHVIIRAPVARASTPVAPPTAEEVVAFQAARIRELEAQDQSRTVAANTIAMAAINLFDRVCALSDVTRESGVVIDKETWERKTGLQLTVDPDDLLGLVTIRVREVEKPAPLAWEDRRDG